MNLEYARCDIEKGVILVRSRDSIGVLEAESTVLLPYHQHRAYLSQQNHADVIMTTLGALSVQALLFHVT